MHVNQLAMDVKMRQVSAVTRFLGGAMAAVILCAPAASAAAPPASQYEACLNRAQGDPSGALMLASSWAKSGGGAPAEHCAAVALVGLRRFAEAATRLDALGASPTTGGADMRTAIYDQAGNAWLLAGQADRAVASFSAALGIDPLDADLLADRARANAFKKNWARAESDLTAALMVDPNRADLYVLRGSARHGMGRRADARADFEYALKLQPNNADALVERGTAKLEDGDVAGARADWQRVVGMAPGTAAAESARQHLEDSAPAK
jgi:tetratricopeptide (TPR) repeat protein